MLVKNCPVDAIHTFQVRTLRALGYRTRVALSNKSHTRPELRTDYRVDVSVYTRGARRFVGDVARLAAGGRALIDCEPYCDDEGTLVFHLVPLRFADAVTAEVERDDMMFLASVQDHYVEYYRDDGCSAGVLYQTGPFNHPVFSPKSTTLIQAPKFYVSSEIDSYLSLLNASADPAYRRVAKLRCTIAAAGRTHAFTEVVYPFEPVLISLRDRLQRLGVELSAEPTFACVYAVCENATVIPLTIQRADTTGAIGIEHSLPPDYYASTMRGPARGRAMQRLLGSAIFEGTS
ncbi:MAG: hypothetical protein ABI867_15275 [Kofleriaceae bacterium]